VGLLRLRSRAGVLRLVARDSKTGEAAGDLGLAAASEGRSATVAIPFVDGPAWFKGEPLRGKAAWRHGVRSRLLRLHLPRVNEFHNLGWLARRSFQVAPPLAAGVLFRAGLPRYQFLVTSEIRDARTLRQFLVDEEIGREEVLAELAREVGRMHAVGFVHRDLFPRNVLVLPPRRARGRIVFIDAWRGGPRSQLRGPAHDLGCLFLHGPELLRGGEPALLFDAYVSARGAQGRGVEARSFLRAVRRARRRLRRRLEDDPRRLGGAPLPPLEWSL
jgi:tRNA A-37 threonylcarbamoyl transferase component Bud32